MDKDILISLVYNFLVEENLITTAKALLKETGKIKSTDHNLVSLLKTL
jgi:hypothetical protein